MQPQCLAAVIERASDRVACLPRKASMWLRGSRLFIRNGERLACDVLAPQWLMKRRGGLEKSRPGAVAGAAWL